MLLKRRLASRCCLDTITGWPRLTRSFQIIARRMKKAIKILFRKSISLKTIGVAVQVKRLSSNRKRTAKTPRNHRASAAPPKAEKMSRPRNKMVPTKFLLFTSLAIKSYTVGLTPSPHCCSTTRKSLRPICSCLFRSKF